MGSYILRRLILMIPTLLGITFLVFMLIALSPGGIGASLKFSAGGQMSQTSAAIQQAYLEDRYGLNDPVIVQYVRWLGRISPIKFGVRDQVAPDGELVREPKSADKPILWRWFTDSLPTVDDKGVYQWPLDKWRDEGLSADQIAQRKIAMFRSVRNEYAKARAQYVGSRARFELAVSIYAKSDKVDLPQAITSDGKVRQRILRRAGPDKSSEHWPQVAQAGGAMIDAYKSLLESRAVELAMFRARPYPQAGVPIIPGYVSVAMPDFGRSFSKSRPVTDLIATHLPVTLLLNLIAVPIVYFVAIPSGMLAAVRQGKFFDVASGMVFIALWSFPVMLAGILCIGYLANNDVFGWFPVSGLHDAAADGFTWLPTVVDGHWHRGYVLDCLWHVCLPVLCLVYAGFAVLAKQTRAAMLDNFNADYVRTALAKGVPAKDVILRHVFRNSLLPLITMFVTIFPTMLSGSIVVEKIFTIPGMGYLALDAINLRDRELVLATTLMIGGVNLLALLLADILYAMADPRITYD